MALSACDTTESDLYCHTEIFREAVEALFCVKQES